MTAKAAHPQFGPIVHLTHWIQNGLARIAFGANDRIVCDDWQIGSFFDRLVQAAQWHHQTCGIDATGRPHVPCEPNTISILVLLYVFLVCGHGRRVDEDLCVCVRREMLYDQGRSAIGVQSPLATTYPTNRRRLCVCTFLLRTKVFTTYFLVWKLNAQIEKSTRLCGRTSGWHFFSIASKKNTQKYWWFVASHVICGDSSTNTAANFAAKIVPPSLRSTLN